MFKKKGLCLLLCCYALGVLQPSMAQVDPAKDSTAKDSTTAMPKPPATDTSSKANKATVASPPNALPANDTTTKPAQSPAGIKDTTTAAQPDTTLPAVSSADTTAGDSTKYVLGMVSTRSGKSLEGATIKGSNGITVPANASGGFKIPYQPNLQLTVSSVGFHDTTVNVTSAGEYVKIVLSGDHEQHELTEVKVTALGISKNGNSVGYSVQEIKGAAVQTAKETNFVNAMQGKLAGVQINGNTGSMGGSSKITIRGNKSITGNNNALFVVDGVFMGNSNPVPSYNQAIGGGGFDYGSPIQDINPDDIDQISVLKGAAATALYGSRGSNGVVLITTKKGNTGNKLGVSYSMNAQMDQVYVLPNYQNMYGGGAATSDYSSGVFDTLWHDEHPEQFKGAPTYNDPTRGGYDLMPQYAVDESWGPKLEGQTIRPYYSFDKDKNNPYFGVTAPWSAHPDNVRNFFKTGVTLTNSVSVGGGNEDGAFRLSYSNMNQHYIMPGSKQVRNNLGFNGSYNLVPNLTAIVSANYSVNDVQGRIGTGFSGLNPMELFSMYSQRQLDVEKLKYYQFPDGSQVSWNRKSFDDPTPASATSPYWNAYKAYETDTRTRLYGQAGLEYRPLDWLNLSAKVFMDQFSTLQEERTPQDLLSGQTGGYGRTDIDHQELNYQFMATAKRDLSSRFGINATIGGNILTQEDGVNTGRFTGLIVPGLYSLSNSSGRVTYNNYLFKKRVNSLFADVILSFDESQYLELTGRNDWSSALAQGNNSYFYPSASYSMIFSNWLTNWKWLSYGKFRASVAQIGSDTDPYRTQLAYGAPVPFSGGSYVLKDPALYNAALRPERSTEYETGVELKFLNNRIGLDLTAYSRTTKDLIIPLTVSSATGYNTFYANAGKSKSQGIEVQLSGRPIQTKNFSWDATINFSTNKSELLSLDIPNNPDIQGYIVGTERRRNSVSTEAIVGQPLFVLTGTDYTYMNGKKVIDSSGHYVPSEPGQILGNTEPDFIGGFSNTFTYKNISLSALVDFQKGGSFFSYTNMYGLASGLLQETVADGVRDNGVVVSGVLPSGEDYEKTLQAADHFKNNYGMNINASNVYDASYIYLREVTVGYQLPESWAAAIHSSHATISLYGRNLWLIHSNAPNVDPSNILNSPGNITGLEGGALPSVRSYGINLNVGF